MARTLAMIRRRASAQGRTCSRSPAWPASWRRSGRAISFRSAIRSRSRHASIEFEPVGDGVRIRATVEDEWRHGVEMEALTGRRSGRAHPVRHVQGGRPGHDHRRPGASAQRGREVRAMAARRGVVAMPLPTGSRRFREPKACGGPCARHGERTAPSSSIVGLRATPTAGDWHRQVSLLGQESIDKMVRRASTSPRRLRREHHDVRNRLLGPADRQRYQDWTLGRPRDQPDRQGLPHQVCDLLPGRRLRNAPRRPLRGGARGRRGPHRRPHRGAVARRRNVRPDAGLRDRGARGGEGCPRPRRRHAAARARLRARKRGCRAAGRRIQFGRCGRGPVESVVDPIITSVDLTTATICFPGARPEPAGGLGR